MKKHLIYDYEEGDEVKVKYNGKTRFHTIDTLTKEKVTFEDGTEFVVNRHSKNNGEIRPSEESELSEALGSATVIPSLY